MNILIIQTAFIGDVVLATPLIEKLHQHFPDANIDFLLRKGNEGLLENHPYLRNVFIWNKQEKKVAGLQKVIKQIRKEKFDMVINLHRFTSSGVITSFSGAKDMRGFDKNPLSHFFTRTFKHEIGNGKHEIERNLELIADLTDDKIVKPKLYPSEQDFEKVKHFQEAPYVCIAPASVWFTKQFPEDKWLELIKLLPEEKALFLLGGKTDQELCTDIINKAGHKRSTNLAGKLTFLETAALMQGAEMNYVNDSAPMHFASAMNAPTTAIFCSTVPSFGFGPLADKAVIWEVKEDLPCRPCGLHGHKACPEGHFKCAFDIQVKVES